MVTKAGAKKAVALALLKLILVFGPLGANIWYVQTKHLHGAAVTAGWGICIFWIIGTLYLFRGSTSSSILDDSGVPKTE